MIAPMITTKVPRLLYGGDYNPEQWPEAVWRDDARLMREAGVNLVTVGVFAWALLEPRPGQYDFGWLDRVMDLLHEHGIFVDLATATASPPPWMAMLHPESLPVTVDGVTLWPGGRQQYCPSGVAYRARAGALARELAARYGHHPALAMWHINNEYGCHVSACYCDVSARAFREWLQRRYATLAALNEAWGTAFWSQHYTAWDEILPPRRTPYFANPTQQLDFLRFSSDALLDLFQMERAILKDVTPDVPVVTNFMGFFKPVDYWKWAPHEDIIADDAYPDPADPEAHVTAAMRYDLMRSLAGEKPWMLMEQAPSQVNWRDRNAPKRPGQMRLWSVQAVARGADGVMFFQWRASKAGAEKHHSGMVPHAGTESRTWREVVRLGADLDRLRAVRGARVPAEVGVVFDWENWWALELDSHPSSALLLMDQVTAFYRPLYARNIAVDFVPPDGDLSGYKVVLVPNLYLVSGGTAHNLERFVTGGGTLVMSFFSGIVDGSDHILLGGYPAPFRDVLGLRVEEFAPFAGSQTNRIVDSAGQTYGCELWADVIALEGAEALASFADDFYAGRPAVTRYAFGKGQSYYLGTRPDAAYLDALLGRVLDEREIRPIAEMPSGVEVVRRVADGDTFVFLLNHGSERVELAAPRHTRDLLTGKHARKRITLEPYGAAVLHQERR